MAKTLIHNCTTGVVEVQDMTPQDEEYRATLHTTALARAQERQDAENQRANLAASARGKLQALGITPEELKAILEG